jgi:hypothetical protein
VTNITDAQAPNQVQTLDRSLRWFSLTMLPTYNYGTTYMIEVAVKTNGLFSGYGAPCFVTTGAVPALTNCSQIVANDNTIVYTTSMSKATSYRFQLTNLATGLLTTITRPLHWFRFSMISGYAAWQQYDVQVAVMTSGSYSLYGDACTKTAPGSARMADVKGEILPAADFKVLAYPNPYNESFTIDVEDSASEAVTINIYDMMGRQLQVKKIPAADVHLQHFGKDFPSGIYNVIVSQGDKIKALRLIKR